MQNYIDIGQHKPLIWNMNLRLYKEEETAFVAIYKSCMNSVYGLACRMLNDLNEAEDITQEVFLRLYRALVEGIELNNPRAWLMVTTRNLCLNAIRDMRQEVPLESVDISAWQKGQTSPDVNRHLNAAIAQLDIKQREILILKEYEGCSYSEIAEITETTIAGVRSALYRARLELATLFEKTYKGR